MAEEDNGFARDLYGSTSPTNLNANNTSKAGDDATGKPQLKGRKQGTIIDFKPRILLMGLRRSGKSSIQKVVFQKMPPHETLFLESTSKLVKNDISNNSFISYQIWDFPGQIDFLSDAFDSDVMFGGSGALVFVIDAQDDTNEALNKLLMTITKAHQVNPDLVYEVLIHKVDGLSDDHKIETQREIQEQVMNELTDRNLVDSVHIRFHLTSIYDHLIFEAFSKIVQKLIPQLPALESLLDSFISTSKIEKAFLFDVVSKIYIATDSTPVDNSIYELCSDMIDVVIDVSCIYGMKDGNDPFSYDPDSAAIIRLSNQTVLYLKEVNRYLALVCVVKEDHADRMGLIDYNFTMLRSAVEQVFAVRDEVLQKKSKPKKK